MTRRIGTLPPAPRPSDYYLRLGEEYAERAAPAIVEEARAQGVPLPLTRDYELRPAMRASRELCVSETGASVGDGRRAGYVDFSVGWWNRLTKLGVYKIKPY